MRRGVAAAARPCVTVPPLPPWSARARPRHGHRPQATSPPKRPRARRHLASTPPAVRICGRVNGGEGQVGTGRAHRQLCRKWGGGLVQGRGRWVATHLRF
eukprot:74944-Chlamydomonas_euryale.AAC.1